jgi:hypothetical protein
MSHIEQDECTVIGVQDFQVQRAERQLQKDAWEAEAEPFGINPSTRSHSILNSNARGDLFAAGPGDESVCSANSQFPPLAQSQVSRPVDRIPQPSTQHAKATSNLIDLDDTSRAMSTLNINQQSWSFQQPPPQSEQYSNNPRIKGWLKQVNTTAEPPSDNASEVASIYDKRDSGITSTVPPSTLASANPDAPHQHIINMPAHTVVSTSRLEIGKYWDPIRQCYACPTSKCKRQFRTTEEFRSHLFTSSHVGGQVTCPSCLKRFVTTAAWVAHTESASKRCAIRNSYNYNQVMREITGGVLGTQGFNENGSVKFVAPKIHEWNEDS